MIRSLLVGLGAVLSMAGTGCFETQRRDELLFAVRDYNEGLRWGKIEQSASHLPVDARKAFADRYSPISDDLEVIDFEVQRMELAPDHASAEVHVDVTWSLKRRGLVERTVVKQRWEKTGTALVNHWVLTKQERFKGSPLALIE